MLLSTAIGGGQSMERWCRGYGVSGGEEEGGHKGEKMEEEERREKERKREVDVSIEERKMMEKKRWVAAGGLQPPRAATVSARALWNMEKQILDYTLVPAGLLLMAAYHIWLLFFILNHPNKTVIGVNAFNRRFWVSAMMEDVSKNGVLAVQTLRNNMMASTVLASTAIMLSSVMAALMASKNGDRSFGVVFGDKSALGISIKYLAILVCFLLSFLLNVQSIRYYSHASILINVPFKKMSLSPNSHQLTAEYVGTIVNNGCYFWSLGLRAFYFSIPLFLWLFGPIPMFFILPSHGFHALFSRHHLQIHLAFWASELEENHPHNGEGSSLMV
ncbi:hypothetical protein CK203_075499 [Vitis vinifera]|uniref:Uncharacterized protein n=1 Tax=Vitis vinifera TaxID=29760 RepID=A0A438EU75_VITVI|nr:hypothetical protein CK203_075499 [Vitis vinifera]